MIPGVAIYGGFGGGETLLSLRNITANVTRLSGDLHRDDGPAFTNRSDNSQHVLKIAGVQGVVLDGFTISGGETAGYGAGLYADNATLSIVNCTFTDNRAGDPAGNGGGGALYASSTARIVVDKCMIDGTLIVQGEGLIQNTNLHVSQARLEGEITLQNNELELIETSAGFGGEFFVGGNVQALGNHITSEGDRYLDLDPDAENQNPLIHDNTIDVKILPTGTPDEDTLLELRGLDLDCIGTDCPSGAFPAPAGSPGFTADPSDNWVLESLEVLGDPGGVNPGRVTLTNREGYQFQSDLTHPETVYVKTLKLHPYAVLNTALQRLYYQHLYLVDDSGAETEWTAGPPYPAEFSNHSSIIDHSILGFSLVKLGDG